MEVVGVSLSGTRARVFVARSHSQASPQTQHVVLGALLDAEKDQVTANEPFQLDLENECETLRKVMQQVVSSDTSILDTCADA